MNWSIPTDCFDYAPATIAERLFSRDRRALLFGQPGIGKTTLAAGLASHLSKDDRHVWCLGVDPGSPAFGVPGAVCLGQWRDSAWSLRSLSALCSLDAARFRLPLVYAAGGLLKEVSDGVLLLDAPGVTRGVAGAELLSSLVYAADIDLVVVLTRAGNPPPLPNELSALDIEVTYIHASEKAKRPGKKTRARNRTALWDHYLEGAKEYTLPLRELQPIGTPPRNSPEAWIGKQVALIEGDRTLAMAEVTGADNESLRIRTPLDRRPSGTLLVRDGCRDTDGMLSTGKPFADKLVRYIPPPDLLPDAAIPAEGGIRPLVNIGTAMATLVNGVFGDPLLHLRLRHQRRSLLFDLGDGSRLPARISHQVSDVFITHAHVDHISGFLWLLRSRIGEKSLCRLYVPPGLASNIAGLIQGIHWDRIGDRGPLFEVVELHIDRLRRYSLQAGRPDYELIEEVDIPDGVLLDETDFRICAVTLDHGTPVLAYSYEPARQINVRKERLEMRSLDPGPWLNELKKHIHAGEDLVRMTLPDGTEETVASLTDRLTLITPGNKLVYATDFADTPDNRQKLTTIAQGAHTLFCEATFLQQERDQAERTGHLTTTACAEIANDSRVLHLIPFHFSRRYEEDPWRIYKEIAATCPQVVMP
jgi:ribonuclease BN (tRNA processing enzyme)